MPTQTPQQHIILREQTKLLFQHLPFVLYGVMAASVGLVAVLWQYVDRPTLLLWLAAVYLLTGVRWFMRMRFLKLGAQFNAQQWLQTAILLTAASGVLWGIAGLAFFSSDPVALLALATFLAAMLAGAVSSHACHTPAYAAFALPASLPFIARCVWEGDPFFLVLGTVSLLFVFINIHYGRNLQSMVTQSIQLRFQNAELVGELTLQKRLAEQASAAKTRFLATISHDLRQPVQAIELLVDALQEDLVSHPSRNLLDLIQEAGQGLRNLLGTMLDSARINADAITPKPRHVKLSPILKNIHKDCSQQARQKGLHLRIAKTSAWVYTDPTLLELILRNYVENAIKYTSRGSVLIGCRKQGRQLRIEVHDTGIGIPEAAQKNVFQEFYQLGNVERDKTKGLGLGLYVSQSLAKLLNHEVGVRSVLGAGSLFHVTVPQGEASYFLDDTAQTPLGQGMLIGKTVLLIEDDDMVRASVAEMLNRWHCKTIAAEDAATALRILADLKMRPDAIVADYRLRNRSTGVDAINTLHSTFGKIPAVILTGDTAPNRIQEVQNSGYPILHKPLSGVKLRNMLSSMMSNQEGRQEAS